MRFTLFSISIFSVVCLFGCQTNNATEAKLKKYLELDISKTNVQELISCDSMAIATTSIHDSLFYVFRIPPNACSSCYNQEISTMKDFFKEGSLPIIVTSFDNCRDFRVFGSSFGFNKAELFNATSLIKTLDEQAVPYYLLLDSSYTIKDVFVTKKNNHLSTIIFFSSHSPAITKIKFEAHTINLNVLEQDVPKSATFNFTNIGNKPLTIYHIKSSCGCTKTKWSKKPIRPNERGEISVTYDAKSPGKFRKSLTLFCNTSKGIEVLWLEGIVD